MAMRPGHQRFGRAVEAQSPAAHDRQGARTRFDVGDDVGGQDDQSLARQLREKVTKAHALFGIEADRGFVDDQQLRVVEQCLGNAHALAHATGIAAEPAVGQVVQPDHMQALIHARRHAAWWQALHRGKEGQEFACRQGFIDAEILRQVAKLAPQRVGLAGDVLATPQHPPAAGLGQGGQHPHQGRLAGAIRPEQPDDPRRQHQPHVRDRLVPAAIAVAHRFQRQFQRHAQHPNLDELVC